MKKKRIGSKPIKRFHNPSQQENDQLRQEADRLGGTGMFDFLTAEVEKFKQEFPKTHGGRMPTREEVLSFSMKLGQRAAERKNKNS